MTCVFVVSQLCLYLYVTSYEIFYTCDLWFGIQALAESLLCWCRSYQFLGSALRMARCVCCWLRGFGLEIFCWVLHDKMSPGYAVIARSECWILVCYPVVQTEEAPVSSDGEALRWVGISERWHQHLLSLPHIGLQSSETLLARSDFFINCKIKDKLITKLSVQ